VTVLLDANVLIALLVDDHIDHGAAEDWFGGMSENFATCPITQGSLMRLLISRGPARRAGAGGA
jgi:predicted nucleic acid-binding protein